MVCGFKSKVRFIQCVKFLLRSYELYFYIAKFYYCFAFNIIQVYLFKYFYTVPCVKYYLFI